MKKLKLLIKKIIPFYLAGASIFYSNDLFSQNISNFLKMDTLAYEFVEYKTCLFGRETEEIIALDTNQNKISDYVIKKTINNKLLGKKSLELERWINDNDKKNQLFDRYEFTKKEYNLFGKEKYSGTIIVEDTAEINKFYAVPIFDGKKFKLNKDVE